MPTAQLSWREKWRNGIRASETGLLFGIWIGGITASDMLIVNLLLLGGFLLSVLALLVDPVRSSLWKLTIGCLVGLWFAGSAFGVQYRHKALDNAAAPVASSQPRLHFSQTQIISTDTLLPGQGDTLNLDNTASLEIFPPYSLEDVTLVLDPNPTYYPGYQNKDINVLSLAITHGQHTQYKLDKNKNKSISVQVANRKFLVTLISTRLVGTSTFAVPIEYTFGISEE